MAETACPSVLARTGWTFRPRSGKGKSEFRFSPLESGWQLARLQALSMAKGTPMATCILTEPRICGANLVAIWKRSVLERLEAARSDTRAASRCCNFQDERLQDG